VRQQDDVKQVINWGPTNIKCHPTQFSRQGDLAPLNWVPKTGNYLKICILSSQSVYCYRLVSVYPHTLPPSVCQCTHILLPPSVGVPTYCYNLVSVYPHIVTAYCQCTHIRYRLVSVSVPTYCYRLLSVYPHTLPPSVCQCTHILLPPSVGVPTYCYNLVSVYPHIVTA